MKYVLTFLVGVVFFAGTLLVLGQQRFEKRLEVTASGCLLGGATYSECTCVVEQVQSELGYQKSAVLGSGVLRSLFDLDYRAEIEAVMPSAVSFCASA